MTVFLDKLLSYQDNKYLLAKAAMYSIDKIANMKGELEEEEEETERSVIDVLEMVLDKKVNFLLQEAEEE